MRQYVTRARYQIFFLAVMICLPVMGQGPVDHPMLAPFRLPMPEDVAAVEYVDLDSDGDPDEMNYLLWDSVPVKWLDDDDDMQFTDLSGDLDNDCLLIDLNKDGKYGNELDLVVDWNDENGDGVADMQAILENGRADYRGKWYSHYMYMINTGNRGVFNYIDWDDLRMEGWDRMGRCNFFSNYHGNSVMLKAHISSFDIKDIRFSWENPFLFYDEDGDGYSEMAARLVDEPVETGRKSKKYTYEFTGNISLVQLSFDMDNDNGPSNAVDYDMSLKFYGEGFDYSDQVHRFEKMTGLEGTGDYFCDQRFRTNNELIYCDHDSAFPLIFQRGQWEGCWLVFDEDDDCHRWERVEFYDPLDPYKIGAGNGGLDNNPQSDVSGDRGEWDEDFSGRGNLYVSDLDNRIHLLGAEYGYWRVDQFSMYYQGWQGWRGKNHIQGEDFVFEEPEKAPVIRYRDVDQNGFFDEISYDMDADRHFEEVVSLPGLGLSDSALIIQTQTLTFSDYNRLFEEVADRNWNQALNALMTMKKLGIDPSWYNALSEAHSLQEKYNNGFWISYYCYLDMKHYFTAINRPEMVEKLRIAYYSNNWDLLFE